MQEMLTGMHLHPAIWSHLAITTYFTFTSVPVPHGNPVLVLSQSSLARWSSEPGLKLCILTEFVTCENLILSWTMLFSSHVSGCWLYSSVICAFVINTSTYPYLFLYLFLIIHVIYTERLSLVILCNFSAIFCTLQVSRVRLDSQALQVLGETREQLDL